MKVRDQSAFYRIHFVKSTHIHTYSQLGSLVIKLIDKYLPRKYFKPSFSSFSQKFASDSDCTFFVHSAFQILQLYYLIKIIIQVSSGSLTVGMLSKNFKETLKECIAKDKAVIMTSVKGIPA